MLVTVEQVHKEALRHSAILFQISHPSQQLYIPAGGLPLWSFPAASSTGMYCRNRCKQIMPRHKSTRKQLNVNRVSDPLGSPLRMQRKHTGSVPRRPHAHTHTLALNHGGTCWSHPISTYAQCIRKGELIHILNLSIALCFIVKHLFCNSHQGDKRQQSHASSCSPLLLRLCAGSCFADQWTGSGAGHKAPQIKERENREEWGLPPSGDLPLRQRGRKGEAERRKRL